MSWILSNWVERRAAKDKNLRNAANVWTAVLAAIAEVCESLAKYYPHIAKVTWSRQNSAAVIITITQRGCSPAESDDEPRTEVLWLTFDAAKLHIRVARNDQSKEFPICADSDHAFIALAGTELPLDEFSRLVLEEAFFSEPLPKNSAGKIRLIR